MCGEKTGLSSRISPCGGSPPRVRGKAVVAASPIGRCWITPACAGKSFVGIYDISNGKDHPRVCGEKEHRDESYGFLLGSPPRVRGKGMLRSISRFLSRITPACAGKRSMSLPSKAPYQDHPRVCGEKLWLWQGRQRD